MPCSSKDWPSVSVVIVARNCARILAECLARIRRQDYPEERLEILVIDGGSQDDTAEVARRLGAEVVAGGYPENAEARRYVGVCHARNEILAFIDADNMLPHDDWLSRMVAPFREHPELVGSFTRWYGWEAGDSPLNQYYALVGGNDPIAFYLGKNDRVPFGSTRLPLGASVVEERNGYRLVTLRPDRLPVIGCNGFLMRKEIISRFTLQDANAYMHTDVHVDIMRDLGLNRYAIVDEVIIHLTGDTIGRSIRKRLGYMNHHHVGLSALRRYKVFDAGRLEDVARLALTLFLAVTWVEPTGRAVMGYLWTGNKNWLWHPIMTFLMTVGYGFSVLRRSFGI